MATFNINDSQLENNKLTKSTTQQPIQTNKASLSLFMTKQEAEKAGTETLNLFNTFNTHTGSENYIDNLEFSRYKKGITGTTEEDKPADIHKLPTVEQFEGFLNKAYENIGIDENIKKNILKAKNSKDKKDISILVSEHFGIDITKYNTEEEQIQAISDAINKKYSTKNTDENSVYQTHYKRLKAGNFTDKEKEFLNGKTSITDEEQLKKYTHMATVANQIAELTELFASGDIETQKILIKTIDQYESQVQTGIIGTAILSVDDKESRMKFAKTIADMDLKLTDINKKFLEYSMSVMQNNMNVEESTNFIARAYVFETKSAQTLAFETLDKTERSKVERGELTQEEYDQNYVNVYAASAHKIQEASKAYKYVIDNSNENNREGAMNMLASTAYQIKDSSERENSIGILKNSEYYTDNTAVKLDESYQKQILENTYSKDITPNAGIIDTKPQNNNDDYYEQVVSKVFNSDDESTKNDFIDKTFNNLDERKGTTQKRHRMAMKQGILFLNQLIKEDKLQGSLHEAKVINKLKSLSAATLRNLFINLGEKTQHYFLEKKIVNMSDLALLNTGDTRMLSQNIQDNLEKYKEEKAQYA